MNGTILNLSRPEHRVEKHTAPAAGQKTIRLAFALDEADVSIEGKDLAFSFEDGARVVVEGFFAEGAEALGSIILADGLEADALELFQTLYPDLIATAMGPGPAAAGNGLDDYQDAAAGNALLQGVGRLGSLDALAGGGSGPREGGDLPGSYRAVLAEVGESAATAPAPGGGDADGGGDTEPPVVGPLTDDDTIALSGDVLRYLHIHGDSMAGVKEGGTVVFEGVSATGDRWSGGGDADLSGSGRDAPNYIVGGVVGGDVWGHDSISVEAASLTDSVIEGGRGNDTISVNAALQGSLSAVAGDAAGPATLEAASSWEYAPMGNDVIFVREADANSVVSGDVAEMMVNEIRGGNDAIGVSGVTGGRVSGDAGKSMSGAGVVGGDDVITVGSLSSGNISGDAGFHMLDGASGGNDVISVTGNMTGGGISGDAGGNMSGAGTRGGDDNISAGSVIESGKGGLVISGDAANWMNYGAQGGNDVITLSGGVAGNITVSGDAASYMDNGAKGGNDAISLGASAFFSSAAVSGDAVGSLRGGARGGNDTIAIAGMAKTRADSVQAATPNNAVFTVAGDTATDMEGPSFGGNDSIHVGSISTSTAQGAGHAGYNVSYVISGDAGKAVKSGSTGGDDTIRIDSILNTHTDSYNPVHDSVFVSGDARELQSGAAAGNDSISVGRMSGIMNTVAGDAIADMKDAHGGKDTISVEAMDGGSVFGDGSEALRGSSVGGDDSITVGVLKTYDVGFGIGAYYKGGVVSGDGKLLRDDARGGNDAITVGTVGVAGSVNSANISGTIAGDASTDMSGNARGGNDKITVTGTVYQGTIAGDAAGTLFENAMGGNDVISIAAASGHGNIAGDAVNLKDASVGGNDRIDIEKLGAGGRTSAFSYVGGDALTTMQDDARGGNDTIRIGLIEEGSWAGLGIGGDAGNQMLGSSGGGKDYIEIGEMRAGRVGGDAGYSMDGNASGGNDSISIGVLSGGYAGGDSGSAMLGNAVGGNDTITVGVMTGGFVGGDGALVVSYSARSGNDSISVTTMRGGSLGGDAGNSFTSNARGGNDTISITDMSGGFVGGDAGGYLFIQTSGGNDTITIENLSGGFVGGDAGTYMRGDATGGDDSISIAVMTGGDVGGDAGHVNVAASNLDVTGGVSLAEQARGGNDIINVGLMQGGNIYGDGKSMGSDLSVHPKIVWGSGGNNTLTGTGYADILVGGKGADTLTGGGNKDSFVWLDADLDNVTDVITDFSLEQGDRINLLESLAAGRSVSAGVENGCLVLTVLGDNGLTQRIQVTMKGRFSLEGEDFASFAAFAERYGEDPGKIGALLDAMLDKGVTGGHDSISVNVMEGGSIYGDGESMRLGTIGGDDLIQVKTMSGGSIYGDGKVMSGSAGGDDTVQVDALTGTAAKLIDGGGGTDVFIYGNSEGHAVSLASDGSVFISMANSGNNNNTSIINFEGIGGGSGNDTLTGNEYGNTLIGGKGADVLTGGGGADVFVWREGDLDNVTDIITDFSFEDGDRLDLGALLGSGKELSGSIADGKLVITVSDSSVEQTINVTVAGGFTVNNVDYANLAEFSERSQDDSEMMQALLQQMLSNGVL